MKHLTKARLRVPLRDGTVLIGGDGHYWPGVPAPAHGAFEQFVLDLKPAVIVYTGDAIDGARISRHARIAWEQKPMVHEELQECRVRLGAIANFAGDAQKVWCLGNHDARFETRIANALPEYEKVKGVHLKDHFPAWEPCWSVHIGGPRGLLVKHRFKGGATAARNNAISAGMSIATGHTHQLGVVPITDYAGTRYGIECGMLGHPMGPQFMDYTEDNPRNWAMGFIVANFRRGELLWPEIVHVRADGKVEWRGEVL
jgi:hypothetical protein